MGLFGFDSTDKDVVLRRVSGVSSCEVLIQNVLPFSSINDNSAVCSMIFAPRYLFELDIAVTFQSCR
jgi:hypothetical protein